MMYASCPDYYDDVGRGTFQRGYEREILEKLPAFDPLTARSQRDNGALVELFRTFPGSKVNAHVARFVVWGKHADQLIVPQPWNYAFGRDSPLERFVELNGKILLLGCDHDTVTFLHYAEHIVDIPDKRVVRFKVPMTKTAAVCGARWRSSIRRSASHANWPERFFARLVDTYCAKTGNRGGRVGDAPSFLFDAQAFSTSR